MGKLAHGAINTTASEMNIHRSTVARVWKDFHRDALMPSRKVGRVGRTPIYTPGVVVAMVRELPQSLRTTMREISEAKGIPLSTLHRHLKAGTLRRRSTRMKPMLSDDNRAQCLACCDDAVFDDMWDIPTSLVMLLAAVARPRYDTERGTYFDGKIGMWPIVEYRPAQRNSRNRSAGTIVATLVNVDATAKFPISNKRIVLQHDNATPRGGVTNEDLVSSSTDGWTFVHKLVSRSLDDVIHATLTAFELSGGETLGNVFLTLQAVMRLVLENNGGNFFRLPDLRKDALRRAGALMSNVSCLVALLA
ncbi:hypothetical protein H310_15260 [Aphanomyces invadans]|uniref:Transposase Tc1-like domain-containing protein n=1 Tax=Aphanomyces invadans TaxID=157072 RepID=A0A024T7T9_9STRA|nr:hypothetical protein H310_15260 [Aphanomyces invadans]ETV89899.1 hypothetical protein H310_15260 [Aphanomyces invadans]|eukprot:XP_008881469.1 hypothetical protein H310_15260 [Aphanomyces invadans]